jgi:hypothetical protein
MRRSEGRSDGALWGPSNSADSPPLRADDAPTCLGDALRDHGSSLPRAADRRPRRGHLPLDGPHDRRCRLERRDPGRLRPHRGAGLHGVPSRSRLRDPEPRRTAHRGRAIGGRQAGFARPVIRPWAHGTDLSLLGHAHHFESAPTDSLYRNLEVHAPVPARVRRRRAPSIDTHMHMHMWKRRAERRRDRSSARAADRPLRRRPAARPGGPRGPLVRRPVRAVRPTSIWTSATGEARRAVQPTSADPWGAAPRPARRR